MADKQQAVNPRSEVSEEDLFKQNFSIVLAVIEEIQPLLSSNVDQREVLALASMQLSRLLRSGKSLKRRELRRGVEEYLVNVFDVQEPSFEETTGAIGQLTEMDDLLGSRILVVDDSDMTRRQIKYFLRRDGFEVYEAKSGEEALWLINEVDPHLVLMDIVMDGMNGLETCRRIKQDASNALVPVIFLSSQGEREEIVQGFEAGAIDYIVKPFHPGESLSRVRTHLRVRKLMLQREKHIRELKCLNQTKDRVLRMASHDLRNPISAIAGLAEYLVKDAENLNDRQKDLAICIGDASRSVVGLLNELLDVSAINAGTPFKEPFKEEVLMRDMLRNLVNLFRGEAERKGISLTVEAPDERLPIYADRLQMRQVGDNLISNAIKFTPLEGKVTVRCSLVDDTFTFEVRDSGPGIPPEEAHLLFKEFGKTSNRPTNGECSTGLGLSICHRIVKAHGGDLRFENIPGGGSCFRVLLPAH